jgi:predicted transglutaminase-like cysteine proteinase
MPINRDDCWTTLNEVDDEVDALITGSATADLDLYGEDTWKVIDEARVGDCDDYTVTKRARLRDLYSDHKDSFLIAECWTQENPDDFHRITAIEDPGNWVMDVVSPRAKQDGDKTYHLVLLVRTDKGDYIMDNLADEILPWNQARGDR